MFDRNFYRYRTALSCTAIVLALGVFTACSGGEHGAEEGAAVEHEVMEPMATPEPELASDAPRVFFTNVADGDTVTSPVSLEFDVENFEIVPAQIPIVIAAGQGHHHLGVNTDCLESGIVIKKAAPWVHFGDGSNTIDMQLPEGPATLTLQVGDGEHRTLDEDGLCVTIEVTVAAAVEDGEATGGE